MTEGPPQGYCIDPARGPADWADFRALCREYAASLPQIGLSLEHQGFDAEMDTLPGKYAEPRGVILIARDAQGHPAGCVALRPMDDGAAELKRMYVRPAHRGVGLGLALGRAAMHAATERRYPAVRLDTDDTMHAAIAVYRALGFTQRDRYNDDPCECTLWFEARLAPPPGEGAGGVTSSPKRPPAR